jgi:hypothetical protein
MARVEFFLRSANNPCLAALIHTAPLIRTGRALALAFFGWQVSNCRLQNGYGKSALTDLSSGGGEWATFITIDTVVK